MTIADFLTEHMDDVKQIINTLPATFSSHEFIQRFAHRFESNYITFLWEYRRPEGEYGTFKVVHSQIGRFLSNNEAELHIQKTNRVYTQNVFGDDSDNQGWMKV